jgi:hypothetical protein
MAAVELDFDIPEPIGGVKRWLTETLRPLTGVPFREKLGFDLVLREPKIAKLDEPDAETTRTEIAVTAVRIRTVPVPADWCPEYLIERFETEEFDLGRVIVFRLCALHDATYVWAGCAERPATVWAVFEEILKQIEARYPTVGPLWQVSAAQRRARLRADLRMKSGDTIPAPLRDTIPAPLRDTGTAAGDTETGRGGDAERGAVGASVTSTQGERKSRPARVDFSFVADDADRLMLDLYFNEGLSAPVIVQRADVLRFSTPGPWRNWLTALRKQYPGRIPAKKPPQSPKR